MADGGKYADTVQRACISRLRLAVGRDLGHRFPLLGLRTLNLVEKVFELLLCKLVDARRSLRQKTYHAGGLEGKTLTCSSSCL